MDTQEEKKAIRQVSQEDFEQHVLRAAGPVLVDFWAPWCGPCKQVAPVLEKLGSTYDGRLDVAKVNVDENTSLAARYSVRSIPTLLIFKGGEVVDSMVGAAPFQELDRFVSRWV